MPTKEKTTTKAPPRKTRSTRPGKELSTEFAIGIDGHLYVTAEGFKAGATKGRKRFVGYRLTDKEAAKVWGEINRQAFNATLPLRSRRG